MTNIVKHSLALIITAVFVILTMGAAQYFMAQYGVKKEVLAQAERDMQESQHVAIVKTEVETAVRNILPDVQSCLNEHDKFMKITTHLVANNPNIVGAGIAFKPNYFKNLGKNGLYAPYAYDNRPEAELTASTKTKPNVKSDVLGFNYIQREWFVKPMADGTSLWTKPYVDKGGTHILMCTYVEPIIVNGKPVGVFFADVPLKDVSILSQSLNSDISKSGLIIFCIQIASLLLMGFIIWRAVSASYRYKEQYVDPEKDHLIEQLEKLKEVNARLTKRNLELAEKYADLQQRQTDNP